MACNVSAVIAKFKKNKVTKVNMEMLKFHVKKNILLK